jgi:NhaP-type Na+/H+ or K+/H+ antiporter
MLTIKIIATALGAGLLMALFTDLTLEAALAIAALIS